MSDTTPRNLTRKQLKQSRADLTTDDCHRLSNAIFERAKSLKLIEAHQHIAFYMPFNNEVDPAALLHYGLEHHKRCYLPILDPEIPEQLVFASFAADDPLVDNRYGIKEPIYHADNIIAPEMLELVFVPLVGFDVQGNRLGMGAGYYDRTFAFVKQSDAPIPRLIGLAYESQKITAIEPMLWDVKLDGIITEADFYSFKGQP